MFSRLEEEDESLENDRVIRKSGGDVGSMSLPVNWNSA